MPHPWTLEGLIFVFWLLQKSLKSLQESLTQEQLDNWFPKAYRLTLILWDWNVHWRHLRKNPQKIPTLCMIHLLEFPSESQLCTWMEFLLCVCACAHARRFFFLSYYYLVEHLLLMGLVQLNAGPEGSPSFFVNLNKKRGKGKSLCLDPQPQLHPLARKGH